MEWVVIALCVATGLCFEYGIARAKETVDSDDEAMRQRKKRVHNLNGLWLLAWLLGFGSWLTVTDLGPEELELPLLTRLAVEGYALWPEAALVVGVVGAAVSHPVPACVIVWLCYRTYRGVTASSDVVARRWYRATVYGLSLLFVLEIYAGASIALAVRAAYLDERDQPQPAQVTDYGDVTGNHGV